MRNIHLIFVLCSNGHIYGGDFAKFCGLYQKLLLPCGPWSFFETRINYSVSLFFFFYFFYHFREKTDGLWYLSQLSLQNWPLPLELSHYFTFMSKDWLYRLGSNMQLKGGQIPILTYLLLNFTHWITGLPALPTYLVTYPLSC
jgi:hypothetical protein